MKKPLANELLFGDLQNGGAVTVDLGADGTLSFTSVPDKTRKAQRDTIDA